MCSRQEPPPPTPLAAWPLRRLPHLPPPCERPTSARSHKRAAAPAQIVLARAHVRESRTLSLQELSQQEPLLVPVELVAPRMRIGCALADALAAAVEDRAGGEPGPSAVAVAAAFSGERFVVTRGAASGVFVALGRDAGSDDVLRAIWLAAALEHDQGLGIDCGLAAASVHGRAFVAEVLQGGMTLELLSKELSSRPRFERVTAGLVGSNGL